MINDLHQMKKEIVTPTGTVIPVGFHERIIDILIEIDRRQEGIEKSIRSQNIINDKDIVLEPGPYSNENML